MLDRNVFVKYQGLLKRPRVDALFKQGEKSQLISVFAGPGYGKTAAVVSYVQQISIPVAWMRITRLDNVLSRFWSGFMKAFQDIFSEKSLEKLARLGFPDTMQKLDMFLHVFTKEVHDCSDPCLFVVDDYDSIQENTIHFFFQTILEANLDNLTLLIISNVKTDLDFLAAKNGGLTRITAKDIRFTADETRQLLTENGILLQEFQIQDIHRSSEGWPLVLYFLARKFKKFPPAPDEKISNVNLEVVFDVFERDFFSQYNEKTKDLLIRLSLIPGFTEKMCYKLNKCAEMDIINLIHGNVFIAYEETSGLFMIHNMYRSFLREKNYILSEQDRCNTYKIAGDCFMDSGHTMEAIDCYFQGKCHCAMLDAIKIMMNVQMGIGTSIADYFLKRLQELPDNFTKQNPMVDYLKASIYLNNLKVDEAYEIYLHLRDRLEKNPSADAALLGEVYMGLGSVHMLRNLEDFGVYYKKACEYLPGGSPIRQKKTNFIGNNNNFSMQDFRPGALERMERAVHWGVPYMSKVLNGGAAGLQHLFSTEAAYLTNRMKDAQLHAFQAIYTGREAEQMDVICNAYLMLARVFLMSGRLQKATEYIQEIETLINRQQIISLYDLRDYAWSLLYLCTGKLEKIPSWILGVPGDRDQPPITMGRDRLIYAGVLLYNEEYVELLALLEHIEKLYHIRGLWYSRLMVHIFRATAHLKQKNISASLKSMKIAYDMAYHNNITMPFIEMGKYMRSLVNVALQEPDYHFDMNWLETIGAASATYEKKLLAFYRASKSEKPGNMLTQKERAVLEHMAAGLTREEIALEQGISINTVKKYITSIYNKLGAINRSDAIYLATVKGFIDSTALQ